MRIAKTSNLVYGRQGMDRYASDLDKDVKNLFFLSKGKVRFGDGDTATNGENISGQFVQFTSDGTANTEFSVAHTIGSVPVGYIILWQDKSGSLYQGPATGTAWTTTALSLKCSVSSVTFKVFLIK